MEPVTAPDGSRYVLLRFELPGASGLRVRFEEMHLPAGALLFVYGMTASGETTNVTGPYASASIFGGGLWSEPVRGSNAIIEFQFEGDVPPVLPFTATALSPVTSAQLDKLDTVESLAAPTRDAEVRTGLYRGEVVTYVVKDGLAIYDGDIIIGEADRILPAEANPDKSDRRQGHVISYSTGIWTGGIIPYTIDPALPSQNRVTDAIAHWHAALPGIITMVPRTNEKDYIHFAKSSDPYNCSGTVGRGGYGKQYISLGSYCNTGNTIHEIGHGVGLDHEHTREDRNAKVTVYTQNASSSYNFTQNPTQRNDYGMYDYYSILHYPPMAFSKNGKPTVQTIPAGIPIGQLSGLSSYDKATVRGLYAAPVVPLSGTTTGSFTFTTNPNGAYIVIDGVAFTGIRTFSWTLGSAHTVTIGSTTQTSGSVQYVFSGWSNGGALMQTFVASADTPGLTANFVRRFKVTGTPSPSIAGTVTASPADPGSFFSDTTNAALRAAAQPGYCFASWTGLSSTTPSRPTIVVMRSYALTANFLPGSVELGASAVEHGSAASGGSINITITPGCRWQAVLGGSWIKVAEAHNNVSKALSYTVEANTTGVTRTGTITIEDKVFTITQRGTL